MSSLFQFSLRNLLVVIGLISVGLTALFNANGWWDSGLWGLALFMLLLAGFFIAYRRGDRRAFWLGFAIFGWSYFAVLALSQWLPQAQLYERHFVTRLGYLAYHSLLPVSRSSQWVPAPTISDEPAVGSEHPGHDHGGMSGDRTNSPPDPMPPHYIDDISGMGPGPTMVANPRFVPDAEFVRIFHAMGLLLIATSGGKAAQLICRTGRQTPVAS